MSFINKFTDLSATLIKIAINTIENGKSIFYIDQGFLETLLRLL